MKKLEVMFWILVMNTYADGAKIVLIGMEDFTGVIKVLIRTTFSPTVLVRRMSERG